PTDSTLLPYPTLFRSRDHRRDGTDPHLSVTGRTARQPAHHRTDQVQPGERPRSAPAARSVQVRVLRQHHPRAEDPPDHVAGSPQDRKSTRLNSSHVKI